MIDENIAEALYKFQQYIGYSEDPLEAFDRENHLLGLSVLTNFSSAIWPIGCVLIKTCNRQWRYKYISLSGRGLSLVYRMM